MSRFVHSQEIAWLIGSEREVREDPQRAIVADAPRPVQLPRQHYRHRLGPAVECWIQPRSSRSCSNRRSAASSPAERRLLGRVRGINRFRHATMAAKRYGLK